MMLFSIVRSVVFYIAALVTSFTFTLLMLPFTFLPSTIRYDSRVYHRLANWWCRSLLFFSPLSFSVSGRQYLPAYPEEPAIFLVNHTSALDIPIVENLLDGYPHIWISKASYAKIPLFGRLVKRMHLPLKRQDFRNSIGVLKKGIRLSKNRARHMVLFPEGRRYSDGEIHSFQEGFTVFAASLKRPVVPIFIAGLHKIYPKGRIIIDSSQAAVKINIGKPMYVHEHNSRNDFAQAVHAWFVNEQKQLR